MKLGGIALAATLIVAHSASQPDVIGWSLSTDGTYVHNTTGMPCPNAWGWTSRINVYGPTSGPVLGGCIYKGRDDAEVRIRRFAPDAARDAATREKERKLMEQPGDSRSPFGYFTRWDETDAAGRRIPVERYTMKRADLLIDCETRYHPVQSDLVLGFDGLCRSAQKSWLNAPKR